MLSKVSLLLAVFLTAPAFAAEHTVGQKNKAFTQKTLTIKQGDTVHFENQDPFFHNVYSLSDIQTFDLGSYPKGESRDVTFESKGVIPVECAIHPNMSMEISVE
ncbi:MAG: methylamine utilization protein [Gammaproteobacteria bacterium]|nr:methylamine utilization protein [Gammaproteobacteria bacterium]